MGRTKRSVAIVLIAAIFAAMVSSFAFSSRAYAEAGIPRDFIGVVLRVNGDVLTVQAEFGIVDILPNVNTRVVLPLSERATIADLVVGDEVAVSLTADNSLVVDRVLLIPSKSKYRHISGQVVGMTEGSVTVRIPDTDDISLLTSPLTRTINRGYPAKLAVGSYVVVVVARDLTSGGGSEAIEINIVPPPSQTVVAPAPEPTPAARNVAASVSIVGVFEGIDGAGNLVVSGTRLAMTSATKLEEGLVTGQQVTANADMTSDGKLTAVLLVPVKLSAENGSRVTLDGIFDGMIRSGIWVVSGNIVIVDKNSDTDGIPDVGQRVKVNASRLLDGTLVAREIENIRTQETARPEPQSVEMVGAFRGTDSYGNWLVNGIRVAVDSRTRLEGRPAIGRLIRVRASVSPSGVLVATSITAVASESSTVKKTVQVKGLVQRVDESGTITVNGVQVQIGPLSEVSGKPEVDKYVEVEAQLQNDGTLLARLVSAYGSADAARSDRRVTIEGAVQTVREDGTMVVNGISITLDKDTVTEGETIHGSLVRVEGVLNPDGSVLAIVVKGENRLATQSGTEVRIEGSVDSVKRDESGKPVGIVVDGVPVDLRSLTDVAVKLSAGTQVMVNGVIADGTIVARNIGPRATVATAPPTVVITGVIDKVGVNEVSKIDLLGVNGIEVSVQIFTFVEGELKKGNLARVTGYRSGTQYISTAIRASELKRDAAVSPGEDASGAADTVTEQVKGRVDVLQLDSRGRLVALVVAGKRMAVDENTVIDGELERRSRVEIEARVAGLGLTAVSVKVLPADPGSGDSVTP
ncbi:MAG: hypothetical protein FJ319_05460 [SAR202 cluster bacterium]|nr:hypothetical protein [SAR202 cluster bacterium]